MAKNAQSGTLLGAIDKLRKQFASMKSLVTNRKKATNNGRSAETNNKKMYPTKTIVMDQRLTGKPPVAMMHGPFKND